ncbi:UDP-N-acetyl-D-glucosamine dehydrogenase [Ruegeria lacuscaerulensis ITI-1157]|nr:UDP-N-acetyl-D-glucosamine dehydrogenase [Ruegeria lacuscaerulensis ITI-1157]
MVSEMNVEDTPTSKLMEAIETRTAKVGVIGLGYVGLPLSVTAALRGLDVIGFDIDDEKTTLLDKGQSYVAAVTRDMLEQAATSGKSTWTADFSRLSECDVIVICVPTPLTQHREPDLTFVEETAKTIARYMTANTLVVLESTTFPGTTKDVLTPILETGGLVHERDFWTAFSPEREDPGNKTYRTHSIPKIVGGDSETARRLAEAFYAKVVDQVVPVSSAASAEAVKITENIFRAVNIALVNELKVIYDAMGIDIWEVIDGAATKPFGFMPFYPGPGLGGHCIPIDPFYLTWKAREYGHSTRFIELAGEINVNMPRYVIGKLREVLDRQSGKGLSVSRILLVGISYKKNVPDMRESPSVVLMDSLLQAGAQVDFLDPHVDSIPPMREFPHLLGRKAVSPHQIGSENYDAVLISTDHDAIDYAHLVGLGLPIVDTRNAIAARGLPMDLVTKA